MPEEHLDKWLTHRQMARESDKQRAHERCMAEEKTKQVDLWSGAIQTVAWALCLAAVGWALFHSHPGG